MADISALESTTLRRVSIRLLPFLIVAYLVCNIDRTNAGVAATQSYPLAMLPIVGFATLGTVVLLILGQPYRIVATA
jgi:hypothetical protein